MASSPALQYLKEHAVIVGLVSIAAIAVLVFALTRPGAEPAADASAVPTATPTAALQAGAGTQEATAAPSAAADASAAPAAPERATQAPEESGNPVLGASPQAVTAKDWRDYAEAFSRAWVDTSGGRDAWLARLKPMVSPELYTGFQTTDISRIPAVEIEGVSMSEETLAWKTFRGLAYEGALFEGRVSVQADGSWLVDQLLPPSKS